MSSIYNNIFVNNFNIPKISFQSKSGAYTHTTHLADGYTSNPLYDKFGTKEDIESRAKSNPRIKAILAEHNLPVKVNINELNKLKSGHLQSTRVTAAKIYSNLPDNLKEEVNPEVLQEAALFHDYGKVLIPDEVLNKNGKLTSSEWEIMEEHSEIGAELLKDANLNPRTIELVKYHHQNKYNDGYPAITKGYEHGLDSEILTAADKYEALREARSYKAAMTKEEALSVIQEDVNNGIISPEVFAALKKAA